MKYKKIDYEFVDNVPDVIEGGKIYISIPFATAVHKCCCGCGNEVVTPISPVGWELSYNGEGVSLYPSIGNWNFSCQSHYWIKNSSVIASRRWNKEEILRGKNSEETAKVNYFASKQDVNNNKNKLSPKNSLFVKVWEWLKLGS